MSNSRTKTDSKKGTASPQQTLKDLLDQCRDKDCVLAHLVNLYADEYEENPTTDDIHRLQLGATKFSRDRVGQVLDSLRQKKVLASRQGHWHVGNAFNESTDPAARNVATRLLQVDASVHMADKVARRELLILGHLNFDIARARSANGIFDAISEEYGKHKRTLQRDLKALEKKGKVRRVGDDGWVKLSDTEDRKKHAVNSALTLFHRLAGDLLPSEIQEGLKDLFKKAKKQFDEIPQTDPVIRWLSAFALVPGHHYLHTPMAAEARDVAEQAILKGVKVRATWELDELLREGGVDLPMPVVGSISHYIYDMAQGASIAFWPDNDPQHYPRGRQPYILPLQTVELELLADDERKPWPKDYSPLKEPFDKRAYPFDKYRAGTIRYVLRVRDSAMVELKQRKLGTLFHEEVKEGNGWSIVSFVYTDDSETKWYLRSLRDVVLLYPNPLLQSDRMAKKRGQRIEKERLETNFLAFAYSFDKKELRIGEEERRTLAEVKAWKTNPWLVEALLYHFSEIHKGTDKYKEEMRKVEETVNELIIGLVVDPLRFVPEVEEVMALLPVDPSERDLTEALRPIIEGKFPKGTNPAPSVKFDDFGQWNSAKVAKALHFRLTHMKPLLTS